MPDLVVSEHRGKDVNGGPGGNNLRTSLHRDERGGVTLEHALLLAAFTLPMYLILDRMLENLGVYYGMLTFFASIPFG